ncbi:hypothetical protein ID866_11967, partial [Astraeus odoratus]
MTLIIMTVVDEDVDGASAGGKGTGVETGQPVKGNAFPDGIAAADGVGVGVRLTLRLW